MRAERNDVAHNGVVSISGDVQLLVLLSLSIAYGDDKSTITHVPLAETSNIRFSRDRKAPAVPKCFGGNLYTRRGLLALVFAAFDHADDAPHQGDVEPSFLGDSLRRMGILNVVIQNYIENFIGGQRITIFLSGSQLSRWRLL